MSKKEEQPVGQPTKEIREKIDEACKEVILGEEITKLKSQLSQQLAQAKTNYQETQRQMKIWDARINQISGSLATCNTMLEKSQRPKSLILESNNEDKKGKE